MPAPIAVFAFNRPEHLRRALTASTQAGIVTDRADRLDRLTGTTV